MMPYRLLGKSKKWQQRGVYYLLVVDLLWLAGLGVDKQVFEVPLKGALDWIAWPVTVATQHGKQNTNQARHSSTADKFHLTSLYTTKPRLLKALISIQSATVRNSSLAQRHHCMDQLR